MSAVSETLRLFEGYTPIDWLVFGLSLASVALGLVVGYQAYRGFRRHDSRSMQYLSIGLILLTAVPFTVSFVGSWLLYVEPGLAVPEEVLALLVRGPMFAGLALITYSLYTRP